MLVSTLSQRAARYELDMLLFTLASLCSAYAAEGVSLADALASALQHNADLRAAAASLDAARADALAARGALDPSLDASAGLSASESRSYLAGYPMASTASAGSAALGLSGELMTGTSWSISAELARQTSTTESSLGGVMAEQSADNWAGSVGLSARQDLLGLLRPTDATRAVRRAAERADQRALEGLEARQDALAAVANAWWSWKAATERAALGRTSVEAALALERVTEARAEVGSAAAVDLARVRTERLAAMAEASEAQAAAMDAGDTLLELMGRAPGADITPEGEGAPRALATLDVDQHLGAASAHSPALARLDLQLQAARAAAREVRFEGLPSLSATGSAGLSSLDTSASGALRALSGDDALPSWSAGLELSVPIGGRLARGTRLAADADLRSAEVALDAQRRALEGDLRAALREVNTAYGGLMLATERLGVAQMAEDGERARAEEGLVRLDELLDAVEAREQAEVDLLEARLDAWRATLEVARLEGGIDAALRP